jgi:hypothetical protein
LNRRTGRPAPSLRREGREALPGGLDLKLDFICDECVLICNACTSRLVEANRAQPAFRGR